MSNLYPHALRAAQLCEQGDDFEEARAVRDLVASHRELLAKLYAAHQIIVQALVIMTPEQKNRWATRNADDGVDGAGIARVNEREAVLTRARALA